MQILSNHHITNGFQLNISYCFNFIINQLILFIIIIQFIIIIIMQLNTSFILNYPYYPGYFFLVYPLPISNFEPKNAQHTLQTFPLKQLKLQESIINKIETNTNIVLENENQIEAQNQLICQKQIDKRRIQSDNSDRDMDSQYQVNKRQKKSSRNGKKKRKCGPNQERNIIPNLIQQLFSFLSKKKSDYWVKKAFKILEIELGQTMNINRYYIYQKKIKERLDHCVNLQTLKILNDLNLSKFPEIKDCFNPSELKTYQKVSRILASYFLTYISPLLTLHSKKMPFLKRQQHLIGRKIVLQQLKKL